MEVFQHLVFGFGVALSLQNLLYCLGLPYPLIRTG